MMPKLTAEHFLQMIAKRKAANILKQSGGVQKEDVNALRKTLTDRQKEQMKRRLEDNLNDPSTSKAG